MAAVERASARPPFRHHRGSCRDGRARHVRSLSGVSLVDAVAASSAVPGIWPPVTIDGHRYIDGGVYSTANTDLAEGYYRAVVLCPVTRGPDMPTAGTQKSRARSHPPLVVVADADPSQRWANLLDPARRGSALNAGVRQAEEMAADIERYWAAPS